MTKVILAFTGRMASGKGTACDYFVQKHGAVQLRFSTVLRDVLDRLYLPQTRENMQDISTVLRARFGQDLLAKIVARDAEAIQAPLLVVDGVRRPQDVQYLRELPNFHLVAIDVEQKVRYQRMIARRENPDDATKTWEEFVAQDNAEAEVTIPEVMLSADQHIDNNGTSEDFLAKLEAFYNQITHGSEG